MKNSHYVRQTADEEFSEFCVAQTVTHRSFVMVWCVMSIQCKDRLYRRRCDESISIQNRSGKKASAAAEQLVSRWRFRKYAPRGTLLLSQVSYAVRLVRNFAMAWKQPIHEPYRESMSNCQAEVTKSHN